MPIPFPSLSLFLSLLSPSSLISMVTKINNMKTKIRIQILYKITGKGNPKFEYKTGFNPAVCNPHYKLSAQNSMYSWVFPLYLQLANKKIKVTFVHNKKSCKLTNYFGRKSVFLVVVDDHTSPTVTPTANLVLNCFAFVCNDHTRTIAMSICHC